MDMKSRMHSRLFLAIVLLLGVCCNSFLPYIAFADDSQNDYKIELSPASRRVSFKPGEQKKDSLELRNTGAKAVSVDVYAAAYYTDERLDMGASILNDDYTKMAEWITFKNDSGEYQSRITFAMYPNQTITVNYTIGVPTGVVGGGQYAIIFAEFTPIKTADEPVAIYAHSRVGMALFAFVDDEGIVRGAEIDNIRVLDGFALNKKIYVEYTAKNTGNIDFQTSTEMAVSSIFGRELYHDIAVNTVLPERTENIQAVWKDTPTVGIFRMNYTIEALDIKEEGSRVIFLMSTGAICLVIVALTLVTIMIVHRRKNRLWRERRSTALKK